MQLVKLKNIFHTNIFFRVGPIFDLIALQHAKLYGDLTSQVQ